jgi:hypothetical protein
MREGAEQALWEFKLHGNRQNSPSLSLSQIIMIKFSTLNDIYYTLFPVTFKSNGKVVPVLFLTDHHAMKAYWESGDTAPLIL